MILVHARVDDGNHHICIRHGRIGCHSGLNRICLNSRYIPLVWIQGVVGGVVTQNPGVVIRLGIFDKIIPEVFQRRNQCENATTRTVFNVDTVDVFQIGILYPLTANGHEARFLSRQFFLKPKKLFHFGNDVIRQNCIDAWDMR